MEKIKKVDIQEIFKDKNFIKSVKFVIETGKASTSALQRKFGFRYSVAANYLEYMADCGYVSPRIENRKLLATLDVFKEDAKENFYLDEEI